MKIVFCWDDGALEDLKLAALHEKKGIPGIFFVPTNNIEGRKVITPVDIKMMASELIQIGGHTQNHVFLDTIPIEHVYQEIKRNKDYLEAIIGRPVEHFCFPGGKYNTNILKIALSVFSTVRTADTMNFKFDKVICKPSLHFYPRGKKSLVGNAIKNYAFEEAAYTLMQSGSFVDIYKHIIKYESRKENSQVVIWGHSWELEKYNLWNELEDFFEWITYHYSDYIVRYDELFSKVIS